MRAVLGIGTNQGDREENIRCALSALGTVPGVRVMRTASLYETAPVGYLDQPNFLNTAAEVETTLSPRALLGVCLGIEAGMGRVRSFRNGPRIIDIDLLLAEGVHMQEEELTVPHPRMLERAFVLVPLRELFPEGMALGLNFSGESAALGSDGVTFYKDLDIKESEKFKK